MRFRWVAALLTVAGAGLGFLYLGRRGLAAFNLLLAPVLSVAAVLVVFHNFLGSFSTALLAIPFVLLIVAAFPILAWRLTAPIEIANRPRWYEYAAFIVAITVFSEMLRSGLASALPSLRSEITYYTYTVPSWSMKPTLLPGEYYVARFADSADMTRRGQLVLFRDPSANVLRVSRIAAIAGDTIELKSGELKINGVAAADTKLCEAVTVSDAGETGSLFAESKVSAHPFAILRSEEGGRYEQDAIVVPAGSLFLLSDNRDNALDSRYFGVIPVENILRVPIYVLWSDDHGRIGQNLMTLQSTKDLRSACPSG